MSERNDSFGTDFILLGFTAQHELQVLCFLFFIAIYFFTMVGNLGMIFLIRVDSRLHTPMYFFLSHLALLDVCYSSTTLPKTLVNFLADRNTISFAGCATQLFIFAACASTECYLLAAMAYDRYVAVCKPLLYRIIMSQKVCGGLVAGAYTVGMICSATHTIFIFRLPFCRSHRIKHFFCDEPPLLALACSDTHFNEMLLSAVVAFNVLVTIAIILASYTAVLTTVLTIRTTEGRCKAFSTCASHLATVTLFYGSSLFVYSQPSSNYSLGQDKMASVLYSVTVPLLNPLIYSMRNREVKDALRKTRARFLSSIAISVSKE